MVASVPPLQLGLTRPDDFVDLVDYRRRVHALYAAVRSQYRGDPVGAHARWRDGRDALFRTHRQSALDEAQRAGFAGLRYFPYDARLAFTARLVDVDTAGLPEIGSSRGNAPAYVRAGTVELPIGRMTVYWMNAYAGGMFLPFRDSTCGGETYGGGRYLLDTAKGADLGGGVNDELVLDFNFAYHPSCHYNPKWECPLAPAENWLAVPVEAGERAYRAYRLEVEGGSERGTRLVTREAIPVGTQVASFAGAPRLAGPTRYTIQVSDTAHVEDLGLFLNLNHSCDPSVWVDTATLTAHTLRDLAPGDELTFFYPSTEWEMAAPFECLCGAERCLGQIVGAKDLPAEVKARYRMNGHTA